MLIRYIGGFPPPYGGVTVKNQLIYDTIKQHIPIKKLKKIRWLPKYLYEIIEILLSLLPNQRLLIGISASNGKSKIYTKILYTFAKKNMKNSLYFMMGGTEALRIASSKKEIEMYKNFKMIYVETKTMLCQLKEAGMQNVEYFPNCRKRPSSKEPVYTVEGRLKCLFFSRVQTMKGTDIILQTAKLCPSVEFYFYGEIDEDYKNVFLNSVNTCDNVHYNGVFTGRGMELYQELSQYDVLLLPTKWKTEGVPGVVVECKMVGVPAILSDISYNRDLVEREAGYILKNNDSAELCDIIQRLDKDREALINMKKAAYQSASLYDIDTYIRNIEIKINGR